MILSFFILMAMHSNQNYSLKSSNSFNIKASCSRIYFPSSLAELQQLPDLSAENFYILGDGSNTLFVEPQAPIIIQPKFTGIDILERDDHFVVTVGAAENWHDLVCFCLEQGIYGLENLALIPGSVGAAPVQNIGAYGVEFSDFCQEIQWYEFASKTLHSLNKQTCRFAYRDSIFKQERYNKGLITQVTFNPQNNGEIKLAAGWLIEQAGLKGFRHGAVGVHQQQALVLVNYGSDLGAEIISLAKYIQRKVEEKFSVSLTPEVRMITHKGERSFSSLSDINPIRGNSDD